MSCSPIELALADPPLIRLCIVQPRQISAEFARVFAGPPGAAGGATYTHTQAVAAAVWTVAHNLGRRPSVTVTDHLGNEVWPDIRHLDGDLVQVTHGVPLTGFAYCN